jgi:hypothetical protein
MTQQQTNMFLRLAGIALLIGIIGSGLIPAAPNKGFINDAGAVVTFVTLASVGIERILEGFWTFIGLTKGTFWPFTAFSLQITNLSSELNQTLSPFYQQLMQLIDEAKTANNWTDQQYNSAKKQATDLQASVDQIRTLAPGSPQATARASAASQLISAFQKQYPTLDTLATFANESISSLANSIVTPVDNLGRRFISLFLGVALGVVVTGVLRLDLVSTIFQSSIGGLPFNLKFYWGVIVTGVVIGLGSNPTHEAIRVLQEFKNNLKGQNAPTQ